MIVCVCFKYTANFLCFVSVIENMLKKAGRKSNKKKEVKYHMHHHNITLNWSVYEGEM